MGHFGPKWRHSPKFREFGQIFFSPQVFKNNFCQVYGHKFGQKCHKCGQFDQNRSFWMKMVQNWVILDQNGATGQNLGKVVKFFSLKVFKNFFIQVYGYKFGKKCHKWGQFGQNRSFWVKMVQYWVILGQNGATAQNLGKVVKYYFL